MRFEKIDLSKWHVLTRPAELVRQMQNEGVLEAGCCNAPRPQILRVVSLPTLESVSRKRRTCVIRITNGATIAALGIGTKTGNTSKITKRPFAGRFIYFESSTRFAVKIYTTVGDSERVCGKAEITIGSEWSRRQKGEGRTVGDDGMMFTSGLCSLRADHGTGPGTHELKHPRHVVCVAGRGLDVQTLWVRASQQSGMYEHIARHMGIPRRRGRSKGKRSS